MKVPSLEIPPNHSLIYIKHMSMLTPASLFVVRANTKSVGVFGGGVHYAYVENDSVGNMVEALKASGIGGDVCVDSSKWPTGYLLITPTYMTASGG